MPNPSVKFWVYIIESPSASDIYERRSEGELIEKSLSLHGMPCETRTVIDAETMLTAIRKGLPESMKLHPDRFPILHLSAHGMDRGIGLSSAQFIHWEWLRDLLLPVSTSLGGALLLCMSACKGYSACMMAKQLDNSPHPYSVLVGNYGTPSWSDTAVAYTAFYHRLSNGASIPDAVEAMKVASGDEKWISETADASKQGFIDYVHARVNIAAAQEHLRNHPITPPTLPHSQVEE